MTELSFRDHLAHEIRANFECRPLQEETTLTDLITREITAYATHDLATKIVEMSNFIEENHPDKFSPQMHIAALRLHSLEGQNALLQTHIDELRQRNEEVKKDYCTQRDQKYDAVSENEELRKKIEELSQKLVEKKPAPQPPNLVAANRRLQSERDALLSQRDKLLEALKQKDEMMNDLAANRNDIRTQLEQASKQTDETLQEQLREERRIRKGIEDELARLSKQKEGLEDAVHEIQDIDRKLRHEHAARSALLRHLLSKLEKDALVNYLVNPIAVEE